MIDQEPEKALWDTFTEKANSFMRMTSIQSQIGKAFTEGKKRFEVKLDDFNSV